MASTPPPLPSSDEGEFDDDDDFGCFTSSAPIDAGIDSEPEYGAYSFQQIPTQNEANTTEHFVDGVEHDLPVIPTHSTDSDDASNSADYVICNGQQTNTNQSGSEQDSSNTSIAVEDESKCKGLTEEDCCGETPNSTTCDVSQNNDLSSSDFELNSPLNTIVQNSISDNAGSEVCIPDTDQSKEEKYIDHEIKDSKESSSEQEIDDWADFSSAPSDSALQDENVNQVTAAWNKPDPSHPSNQIIESPSNINLSTTDSAELESHSGVTEFDVEKSVTETEEESPIDDCAACSIPSNNQNIVYQEEEDDVNSRHDNEAQSESEPINDTKEASENRTVNSNHSSNKETDNSQDNLNNKPVTNVNDKDDNNDGDDEDFGDYSDFACPKGKESSSEEDVAPISFRTSTCEDDLNEQEENCNDSDNKNKEESPEPYGDDDEDEDEDWGFKVAENPPEDKDDEDFGDFGTGDQEPSTDADWANFSDTTVPKASTASHDPNNFDEEEFESPTSNFSAQTSNQQLSDQEGLSKVEKAVSSSFPHEDQINFYKSIKSSVKDEANDESALAGDRKATVEDSLHSLGSVVGNGLKALPSAKEETWTITEEIRIKDPMVGIWERLKDVNACHALDFGWNSSQCSQDVYSTLHIDTKNVLFSQKKQAVPFFASGLGILEPIRGVANQAEKQIISPPLLDTAKPEESQKEAPQDIPPVDFDWSSSGLTDPLKVFKSDSFSSNLSSFEPFAEILQKNATASQSLPDKELSPEASSILMKIRNLKFMQSKVLMFPIKDS